MLDVKELAAVDWNERVALTDALTSRPGQTTYLASDAFKAKALEFRKTTFDEVYCTNIY